MRLKAVSHSPKGSTIIVKLIMFSLMIIFILLQEANKDYSQLVGDL